MKTKSSLNQDGFYDDNSSSSDDEYLYSPRDFDSDSSDSDYDFPRSPNTRVVFVNGRRIKPKIKCSAAKKIQNGGESNLCGPSPSRRIRFADDGEDRIRPQVTTKNNVTSDVKSKATMTVRIRSSENKTSSCLKAIGDKSPINDKRERRVIENEQRPITKIRIQSIERSSTDKSSNARVIGNGNVAEREFRKLQRTDSGILQSSSSSVSQDTADSFDKEDGSRIESCDSVDKENSNTTSAETDCRDKGRIERQREVTIECARSQLDSGFEDPERVSPGGFSSKENSLKRGATRPLGDNFDDYSNVLRQASLRVFGLVGRRVKAFNEAANKADVTNSGCGVNKEITCNQIGHNEERKIFIGRLEEFYKAKLPLLADAKVQGSGDAVMQNAQNVKEELEEEEWPEPPTFDEDLIEENEKENKDVSECFDVENDSQKSIFEARKIANENLPQDTEEKERNLNGKRQSRSDSVPFDYEQTYRCGSKMYDFQESGAGNEGNFKGCEEGAGNSTDMPADTQHRNVDVYDQRNDYRDNATDHERHRQREFEMGSEYIRRYKERTFDDDCTICELLSSEKRALRRSADMESFRKTALNDCDNVMKKMKHAQQIARKISGSESPRRASMRKAREEGNVSSAQGQTTQFNTTTGIGNRRFEDENDDSTKGVKVGRVDRGLHGDVESAWNSIDVRNQCRIDTDPYGSQNGNRTEDVNSGNVTAATDFHAAARQHSGEQFDAKSFFIQQFNREKTRQKVKRNLSEDFLIVNAMPCAHGTETGKYERSRHNANPSQSIMPRYDVAQGRNLESRHDVQHDELRYNTEAANPRFYSAPNFPRDHPVAKDQWKSAVHHNGENFDNSSGLAYRWSHEKVKSPKVNPLESAPLHQAPMKQPNSNFIPLSPKGNARNGPFTWALHPQSASSYRQQESNKMTSADPFRAEREKSWFKKAARRLRRSLSFEDNSRKGGDKGHASAHMPIRPCNSSGNIKDDYESFVTRETCGLLYSDEGPRMQVSKAAKRSSTMHAVGREHLHMKDPNFHPKYGFMPKDRGSMEKSNSDMRPTSPAYLDANGNALNDVSKFVVQHNMYFGNNPSTPNARSLGTNGATPYRVFNGTEAVVQPLQVRKSSQKTAKAKSLLSRK